MVRWSPWNELLAAGRRVEFRRARLPDRFGGGVAVPQGGAYWAVVVDDRLLGPERRSILAHELVHLERGGGAAYEGMPDAWGAVVARDEAAVDATAAERLVPFDELVAFLERRLTTGEPVLVEELAEHFGVTDDVVVSAVELYDRTHP